MNIIHRNLFRLLRSGAFNAEERIEPMSASKWEKLHQLAVMHDIALLVYQGIQHVRSQFYFHLTDQQWNKWEKTVREVRDNQESYDEDAFLRADHLTNPLLNHKLQNILDDENSDTDTRQLLLIIIRVARHILNEGVPISQLTVLGTFLRTKSHRVDFVTLEKWLKNLRFYAIAQLEGSLLIHLFDFKEDEIPFLKEKQERKIEHVAQELTDFTNTRAQDFYFSQESDNIFVHTSNGAAMLGHIRRSARYFKYFPSETLTNFFASFAHSLSRIEE